ncbi:hypothetical protein EW145_g5900 [Phellinidium pouzarii]|uniref:F-box domain-containing protein n=1 Tax=Phellinidium pouzarii TaxID=167371 RepID=A0A4S4L082_9AGAM|nr:hypothetical protein EW145_g5900 [Phellinidium pouzarii]
MTSIFEVDEIYRTILQYCDRPTLVRLARTSKLLSEVPLDLLWENLEAFSHLLRTFPSNLITWDASERAQPKPTVNYLIVPRDWNRFTSYARRVKTWSPEDLAYIEEPVVDHIAFGRNPEYILPNLTHIEVMATTVSGVHLQTLILCPTLESVTIWNATPTSQTTRSMNAFFRTLADRAHNLRKLTVHWGDGDVVSAPFVNGLSEVFSQGNSALNSVNLWSPECIDARGFSLLAKLPCLTTLHLNLINTDDASKICSEVRSRTDAFPSLQNLFLAGLVEEFPKMLHVFGNSPGMVSLGFSVRKYPMSSHLIQLFTFVASNFPYLRIMQFNVPKEEINIQLANRLYYMDPDSYLQDITVLQPLLDMQSLVAVHLELGVPLHLSDIDLITIASAWPAIEVLNLCSDPYCERTRTAQPLATVQGLFAVASACPSLKHLALFLDCTTGFSENVLANADVVSRTLINLDVGRSWVVEPSLVAALLSGVFPALKVFEWAGMDTSSSQVSDRASGHAASWRQVFDLLPIFRAVRANERRSRKVEITECVMNVD